MRRTRFIHFTNKRVYGGMDSSRKLNLFVCAGQLCPHFIQIGTNHRVFEHPLSLGKALVRVQSWLDHRCTRIVRPTERHWTVIQQMLTDSQAIANMVTDEHLAALAI